MSLKSYDPVIPIVIPNLPSPSGRLDLESRIGKLNIVLDPDPDNYRGRMTG